MKLHVYTAYYEPHKNGVANHITALAKELRGHGAETTVITLDTEEAGRHGEHEGIPVVRLPCINLLGGTFAIPAPGAKKLLEELDQPDIINTHTRFFTTTLLGMRYAKKHGLAHVHTEHGNQHVPHTNPLVRVLAWAWDQTLGRLVMRRADAVVAISKPGVDFCKKLGAEDVTYIPNAIDTERFSPGKTDFRKRRNISRDTKLITYVGRLVKEKGVQDLLEATRDMDVTVVIIGDGPHREALEKHSQQSDADVRFLGAQDQEEIIQALRASDVFVNPSYAEGLPTSVLEAAAVGVPVVATDVGGTRDITQRGLVKPGDVKQLRENINAASPEKLPEEFRIQATAGKFNSILEEYR